MAYSKDSMLVSPTLPNEVWAMLDDIAKKNGYKSTRRFVNKEIRKIAREYASLQKCLGNKDKKRVIYEIPDEHKAVFQNLSCLLGQPSTTILGQHLLSLCIQAHQEEAAPVPKS